MSVHGIVPDSSEEYALISDDSNEVQFKFKIVEFLQNISMELADLQNK